MGIQNFPAVLQPIVQQGYLARAFQDALQSSLAYRRAASREAFPNRIGETVTKTRAGLKAPVTTPIAPQTNTNLDNGLTPSTWTVEQFTLSINLYGDTIDLNMVTDQVGIAAQFVQNAKTNGTQAAQSLDRLARNALFQSYLGGNSRVRTTLGSAAATVAVDDVRGFTQVMAGSGALAGTLQAVSSTFPMSVQLGAGAYTLIAATADGVNVSTAPGGVSGTLTFSSNVSVGDATAGNAVISAVGPRILRPNGRATTAAIQGSDGLTMGLLLDAVAALRSNAVPPIDGMYECYLDPVSSRQLFADPDFKLLFQGQSATDEFRLGRVIELLDVRFVPTTEALTQASPSTAGLTIRRPLICGADALIEGDFVGIAEGDIAPATAIIDKDDNGVAQVTREPLDRLGQIIAQSWYWIGGFCTPTDYTTNPAIVPSASPAYYKRAIVLETAG